MDMNLLIQVSVTRSVFNQVEFLIAPDTCQYIAVHSDISWTSTEQASLTFAD